MWNPSNRIRTIATKILLSIFTLTSIFHILALLQIVPYKYLWGGRLQSLEEMYVMETISLLANIFLFTAVICIYSI